MFIRSIFLPDFLVDFFANSGMIEEIKQIYV